jgi:hypothetical protein
MHSLRIFIISVYIIYFHFTLLTDIQNYKIIIIVLVSYLFKYTSKKISINNKILSDQC